MAQFKGTAYIALAQALSFIPGTHMDNKKLCNSIPRGPAILFRIPWAHMYLVHRYTCGQNTHTHKNL